jgi:hypothetical protein
MTKEPKQQITRKKTSAPKISKAAAAALVTDEDVARRAYELFEARGGLHGFHVEDWLTAEAELRR